MKKYGYFSLVFFFFSSFLFSQNLKELDPKLWEIMKSGKDPKEIEKLYRGYTPNPSQEGNKNLDPLITKHGTRLMDADAYFGWEGHYGPVECVAYNNDGTLLASGGDDGTIRIWNTSTGTLINTILGHTDIVWSVAFSPDGTKLASGSSDYKIKLWNVIDGTLINTLSGHTGYVNSVAFSPDGTKLASGSSDYKIKLWNVIDGTLINTLSGHTGYVNSVTFSPDGTKLASGSSDYKIKLWNVIDGTLINTLSGHTSYVNSVTFSPDGTKLASGSSDYKIKLWNVSNGAVINTLSVSCCYEYSVAFSPDGTKLASGNGDNTIKLWNVNTGSLINTLSGHTDYVRSVAFSPDGTKLTSGSLDNKIKIWNVSTGTLVSTLSGHTWDVYSVAFSPDGTKLATGSLDKTIKLWNVSTGTLINTLSGHGSCVNSVVFSPDGTKLASGGRDNTIYIWNVNTGAIIEYFYHYVYVYSVAFSPDGTKLASGSDYKTIKLWDVNTGSLINTMSGHTSDVYSVAFSPDGTKLASGSADNTVKLWNVSTGSLINTLSHNNCVNSVAFSPDGTKLASGSRDYTIRLWDVGTGYLINTLTGHTYYVNSVAFSPDGRKLVSEGDNTIKIWNVSSGTMLRTITFDHGYPLSIAFNNDGTKIASGGWGYKNIRIYDASVSTSTTARTNLATNITSNSATLNGVINANNLTTTVTFEYGITTSYGSTINATPNTVTGLTNTTVTTNLAGLNSNATYHYRVKAVNSAGTTYGSDQTFTTNVLITAPTAASSTASLVTSSTANLNGTVNANNGTTTVTFEYGTTTSYGSTINAAPNTVTGSTTTPVTANLTGLNSNATYHYRVKAVNSAGTTYGSDQTFTTNVLITAPTAATSTASSVTTSTATLNGTVNANNGTTTVTFEYGTTTSYGSTINATPNTVTGSTNTTVTANLTGLNLNTTYHYRVKAVNTAGTTYGIDQTFTTNVLITVPSAITNTASSITSSTATLNGTVNANNGTTTVTFEYGTTTSYRSTVDASPNAVTGTTVVSVSAALTGLLENTTYHYRLKAVNSAGTSYGNDQTFTTNVLINSPIATTITVSSVTSSTSTLNGTVNANNGTTTVIFEYGTTTSYGNTVDATPNTVTSSTVVSVSASLTGLQANITYHYRIKAVNSAGTSYGIDQTFTTNVLITSPTAITSAASSVTSSMSTLNGTVNANNGTTTVTFEYGTTTSYGNTVDAMPNTVTGSTVVSVSASLTGLQANTIYHYRVKAVNSAGTSYGIDQTFTTNVLITSPTAITSAASSVTSSTSTLNGTVNANNGTTTVTFEYGTSTSYGNTVDATPYTVTGSTVVSVSAALTLLQANTTYHYRVKAVNSAGTSYGNDQIFTTNKKPAIVTNISSFIFGAIKNGKLPDTASFTISNGGGDTLNWNISDDANWLDISPMSGTGTAKIKLNFNTTDLDTGTHKAKITITSPFASNNPKIDTVKYIVIQLPQTIPIIRTIDFPSKKNGSDYNGTEYILFGLPGSSNKHVSEFLSGEPQYDWRMFWDNGADDNWMVEYDDGKNFYFKTGRAFLLLNKGPLNINKSIEGVSADSNEIEIELHPGWNMITNPYTSPIPWNKIQNDNGINQNIFSLVYKDNKFNYDSSGNFEPYKGYWFFNSNPNSNVLKIPINTIVGGGIAKENDHLKWKVDISLTTGDYVDRSAYIGVSDEANEGLDKMDYRKPRILKYMPAVYFNHKEWRETNKYFASDIRPDIINEKEWGFEVNTTPYEMANLSFSGINNIPGYLDVFLLDIDREKYLNLRECADYKFIPTTQNMKFKIIVGSSDEIKKRIIPVKEPDEFELGKNFPNPFNPSTYIPVKIPYSSEIKLVIFNILGTEVRTLFRGQLDPGRYNFEWDGKDKAGKIMTSGVYIYRLITNSGFNSFNKMILIK